MSETPAVASREAETLRVPSPRLSLEPFRRRFTYVGKVSIVTCVAAVPFMVAASAA
jgi:hypothetical protein